MIIGSATVQTKSNLDAVKKAIAGLSNLKIYVGVPEDKSERRGKAEITNAQLVFLHTHGVRSEGMIEEMKPVLDSGTAYPVAHQMYIHKHGSPMMSVPARPIIEPAIEDSENKELIALKFKSMGKAMLDGNNDKVTKEVKRTAILTAGLVKGWFTNSRNNWAPLAESTKKQRKKSELSKNPSIYERKYGGYNPLLDTTDMQKSIRGVIEENGSHQEFE